ncbi:MAG: hypothetical protein WAW06_04715 [bacterium]
MEDLTEQECLEALSLSAARTRDQERCLRIRAWHAGNASARFGATARREFVGVIRRRRHTLALGYDGLCWGLMPREMLKLFLYDHAQRKFPRRTATRRAQARDNLVRLAHLLRVSVTEERLLKAEALRELGHFPAAARLLRTPFPEGLIPAATYIRQLIGRKETGVRELLSIPGFASIQIGGC